MHFIARVALRTRSPLLAKRLVDALGAMMPRLSADRAMYVAASLEGTGTCLTRALTVAARLPGSQVIIGSDGLSGGRFGAHAWVELDGRIVGPSERSRHEIARL